MSSDVTAGLEPRTPSAELRAPERRPQRAAGARPHRAGATAPPAGARGADHPRPRGRRQGHPHAHRRGVPRGVPQPAARTARGRRPRWSVGGTRLALHHRLLRGLAAVLPRRRHRRPRGQRHRQRPRDVRGAPAVPVGRLHPRGGLPGRRPASGSWRRWPAPRPRPASASSPATPRSSSAARPTAATSTPPGSGCSSARRRSAPRPPGPATPCSCPARSATTASRSCSPAASWTSRPTSPPTPRRCTSWSPALLDAGADGVRCCATRPGAASPRSSTRSPPPSDVAVVVDERRRPGPPEVARRLRAARHRPALRGVRGPAGRRRRRREARRRRWPPCAPHPLGAGRGGRSAGSPTTRRAWCCCDRLRRHPDRRPAGRRPAPPHLLRPHPGDGDEWQT